jgi:plasmid maintenance system antidote protein VapI
MENNMHHFGERLRQELEARGMKHSHLAKKLDMTPQRFYQVIHSKDVKLRIAVQVADALDMSIYDLARK